MSILDKLLNKFNVSSYTELNDEERKTYKEWEQALEGRKLTDEDVALFLHSQLTDALEKVTKQRLGDKDDLFLKMKIEFITAVQKFLNTPAVEKKLAESAISQMITR